MSTLGRQTMITRLNQLFRVGNVIFKNQVNRISNMRELNTDQRTTRSGVKRKNPEDNQQVSKAKFTSVDSDQSSSNEISDQVVNKQKKSRKKAGIGTVSRRNPAKDSDDACSSTEKPNSSVKKSAKSSKKAEKLTGKELDDKGTAKEKIQLQIPEIVIPRNQDMVPRIPGPSTWNGTVSYTNQIYLGAHISAAGKINFIYSNNKYNNISKCRWARECSD